jgi:carbon monoxide dehydrogenase subunit G
MVAVSVMVKKSGDTCEDVRVGLTNMSSVPPRATAVEESLRGQSLSAETIAKAAELAAEGTDPPGDLNARPLAATSTPLTTWRLFAMKLEQSFEVAAPIDRVWSTLVDIERAAPCLPGAAVTGRNDDGSYNGTFRIQIGPTSATYSGKLEMNELEEHAHTATMHAAGTDKRGQGGAKATIKSKLTAVGDAATRVEVDTDYHITGRLARFGRGGMIEDISERLLRDFAKCLQTSMAVAPELGAAAAGPSGGSADADRGAGDGDRAAGPGHGVAPGEAGEEAVEAVVASADAGAVEAGVAAADAGAVEAGAASGDAGAVEAGVAAADAGAVEAGAASGDAGAVEAGAGFAQADDGPGQAGGDGGAAPSNGGARVGGAAPVADVSVASDADAGGAGIGRPGSGGAGPPSRSTEALDALALVRSALWDRAKSNPTPFAFVLGLLVALLAFKRARRSR